MSIESQGTDARRFAPPASYLRSFAGLAAAVAACPPSRHHAALAKTVAREPALEGARVTATRDGGWLAAGRVFTQDGELVASDHAAWLESQVAADGGDARRTYARLKDAGHRVSQCNITTIYLAAGDDAGDPSHFLQVEVHLEVELMERLLLDPHPWRTPETLQDLLLDDGPRLDDDQRVAVRTPAYRLHRVVDVEDWLAVADALDQVHREALRARSYRITRTGQEGTSTTIKTQDELFPGWDRFAPQHRRFFLDWQRSSAGRHRLSDHWALNLGDWTDHDGHRSLTLIPVWTLQRPPARVAAHKGSDYALYSALEKLDHRAGVPFGWFFYMLHGNLVDSDAGERVIRAAEAGILVLPERDYRVLKDWQACPYGF